MAQINLNVTNNLELPEEGMVGIGFDTAKKLTAKDDGGNTWEIGGGGGGLVNITYAELIEKMSGNPGGLIPGQQYLLTDFKTTYNIFDGGDCSIIEAAIADDYEPLIITAISTNEIDYTVTSVIYPNDKIYYSPTLLNDGDIGFGDGAGTPVANFKGQIYYRKDTIQNVETHYDFRNVKFRRWAVDAVAYDDGTAYVARNVCKSTDGKIYKCVTATTGEGDPTVNTADWTLWLDITADAFVSWTADKTLFNIGAITTNNLIINNTTAGVDYDDFYTFGDYYNRVKNVSIGMIDLEFSIGELFYATQLNNIVFKTIDNYDTCFSNKISSNNWNNTIGNRFNNNTIGYNFYNNTIENGFYNNTIENYFRTNTIGNDFNSNTIGNDFNNNTIGNRFYNNTIGNNFYSNTIGHYVNYNTIGDKFYSNTIGHNFYNNTIGNNLKHTTIGNDYRIVFGDSITMCTIQDFAFGVLAEDLDLTAATHIRGAYNTTIYQDKTDGVKLSYMDGGVMQIVDVTA